MSKYLTKECKRCEGKGRLAHFGHVHNGVCLKCKGSGILYVTTKAKLATVMQRTRVGSGFSGWTVLQSGWVADDATTDSVLATYVAAGYDADLTHVNVVISDRKTAS